MEPSRVTGIYACSNGIEAHAALARRLRSGLECHPQVAYADDAPLLVGTVAAACDGGGHSRHAGGAVIQKAVTSEFRRVLLAWTTFFAEVLILSDCI